MRSGHSTEAPGAGPLRPHEARLLTGAVKRFQVVPAHAARSTAYALARGPSVAGKLCPSLRQDRESIAQRVRSWVIRSVGQDEGFALESGMSCGFWDDPGLQ